MGVYRRKLKKGWRWFYSGQYLGVKYHSKALYLTKSEASKAERAKKGEMDRHARNPRISMHLVDLSNKRLDHLKLNKSDFYYKENQRYFKKLVDYFGPDCLVDTISKRAINDFIMAEAQRLKKAKKSNHKVNSLIRCLKALFNFGIKTCDIEMLNPLYGIQLYPITINLKHIPSDSDINAVKEISTSEQRLLIDFVEETGARIMEAIRFSEKDIDGQLITLWTRKSKNSNFTPRRIPKPDCLNGVDFKGFEWSSYPRFLEAKVLKLGQKKWSWHNLRHRRASIWATNGLTTLEIMVRLGHSNLETTMRYLQLLGFTRL